MEQMRKSVGLDQVGIHVETQVNVGASAEASFEELLVDIRTAQEQSEPSTISQPNTLRLLSSGDSPVK